MVEGEVVFTSLKAYGGKGRVRIASCTYASVAGLPLPRSLPPPPALLPCFLASLSPPPTSTPHLQPSIAIWLSHLELQQRGD